MEKTLMAITFCNGSDNDLLLKTKQDVETIKRLILEFKQTEKYQSGEYSDDDIIDFMHEQYDDIEGVDIFPVFSIPFCMVE